ncbi:MAG: peptidoglycan DD-metalloendopeptidase family protein [Desulfuromonadales bacterium]|nr:peptidoglycan DD-metalloendopeptidase family protein [Desulfuromonadales bacterium]
MIKKILPHKVLHSLRRLRLRERLTAHLSALQRPALRRRVTLHSGAPLSRILSRKLLWGALTVIILIVAGLSFLPLVSPPPVVVTPTVTIPPPSRERIVTGVVQSGQTLSTILAPYLSSQEIHNLKVTTLTAGHSWKLTLYDDQFQSFVHDINDTYQLLITRPLDGQATAARVEIPYTYAEHAVGGTINDSLFAAMTSIGEEDSLAIILADIFASDIDFIRDIRKGDTFRVIVERRLRDGEPKGYGRILAAEFSNDGRTYHAFRFQDGKKKPAFYDSAGKSLRKALLRAPLPFSRVSSGFTMRRFHPIAKTWRAHPAIDYAAPTGTPIMAVGDATISQIGKTSGNGNYIKLQHAGGLATMYLHMSRFAKGMQKGKRVKQGEVIGYVGSTGLATGPHLCYRMTRNGVPVNPAKIPTTPGEPISRGELESFRALQGPLLAKLATIPTEMTSIAAPPPGTGGE